MQITETQVGVIGTQRVTEFTLVNDAGMSVSIMNYGGIITSLCVPAGDKPHECVSRLPTLQMYQQDSSYLGALVGRYANRIGYGHYTDGGQLMSLDVNGGVHHLHGGFAGFNKKVWDASHHTTKDACILTLTLTSPDGEGGFPGALQVEVSYTLTNDQGLRLDYTATTDKRTPFSLTQHSYFTLGDRSAMKSQLLTLHAAEITAVDDTLLPTGEFTAVEGTAFDFTVPATFADNIQRHPKDLYNTRGYDHNFVLSPRDKEKDPVAILFAPDTGISMTLYTSMPGLQVYTGNILDSNSTPGTVCLEPQFFPDSVNNPHFPDCFITPGNPGSGFIQYYFAHR